MSTTPPKDSVAPPAKSHRVKILLALMILMGTALGWDYWKVSCHDKSLARLQAELERRKALKLTLPRNEVTAFLSGSPKRISNTEATETDFYSWQGWIYQRHLSVQYDAAEMIVKAEDEPEIPPLMEDTLRLLGQKPTPPPARKVSPEEVDAALARAEQAYRQQGGDQSGVFRESLREVFEALPEIKLSTTKGELNWNSFRFSRQKQRLFAFRFTVPQADPVELDYVRWTSAAGYWGVIPLGRTFLAGGGPADSQREVDRYYELLRERKRYDLEANLELEGIGRLEHAGFGARSLKSDWPEKNFILWFESVYFDPTMDFELKTVVFASPAGKAPMRRGLHEISDHIGLRTNVPRVAATPEGVRDALTTLGRLDGFTAYSPATFDRTLRPILKHLPEVTVSTTLGEAHWQKVEFPHGRYAVVRVRIPESLSGEVDLYGAILGAQPSQLGWFCHDWVPDELQSRYMENASTSDPLPAPPNRLTLFSQTKGVVEPGQEVALAIYQFEDSLQARAPMFVTLTAVPHEKSERGTWPRLNAQDYPWSCGKLLGFDTPKPLEPTDCRVLGWHEMNMTHLMFSPDSRRLVSVDLRGDARVWNVESQKLESEFLDHKLKLAYDNAGSVLIAPDCRTLLTFDTDRRAISGWNLDTQERMFVRDVRTLLGQGLLQTAAFGSLPDELAMVLQQGTRLQSQGQTARFIFGNIDNGEVTETPLVVARFASQMLYLPSRELFAVGFIQQRADPISQQPQSVSVVRLYSEDFSKLIQELPLGSHPIERPEQADNSVRLSLTPDSRRLAAIDTRGQLKVWDVTTKTELLSKSVQPKTVEFLGKIPSPQALRDVSLSPDGETVMTTSPHENWVTRWKIADGQPRPTWQTDEIEVTHVGHSHDGKWVATANNDGVIRLWKNTYLDPSFRPVVADIAKSENVGTPKPRPSAIARTNQLNQFVGKWNGKWDDLFQVQITISKTDSGELELLYEWEENVGQPMKRLGPQKAKIESNILVWGSIEMTLEPDNPMLAQAIGKFQNAQERIHRRAVLHRENR